MVVAIANMRSAEFEGGNNAEINFIWVVLKGFFNLNFDLIRPITSKKYNHVKVECITVTFIKREVFSYIFREY